MSSLSRELVFLILQFLDEEKFKETVHKLEQESGFYFNMRYFEEAVVAGEWDDVEKYLSGFTKVDDNRYSMKIFFEIRKQKYLEALDRQDRAKAVEILVKDLKVFASFNDELYKEITSLLTLDNFRDNEQLSKYGDTKSARNIMLLELRKLIEANPLFRDKLSFPGLKLSRLRTLINQSLNWQHQLCKNPRPNPDIKTLFVDHSCGPLASNGMPRVPLVSGVNTNANPGGPKPGTTFQLGAHAAFQPSATVAGPTVGLATWMGPNAATPIPPQATPLAPAIGKRPRSPIALPDGYEEGIKRLKDYHEVREPQISPAAPPAAPPTLPPPNLDDLPRTVVRTLHQGATVTTMDFHPFQHTTLLVGTNTGDVAVWDLRPSEKKVEMRFKSQIVHDTSIAINRAVWSPEGRLIGAAFSKRVVHVFSYNPTLMEVALHLEIDAHNGGVNDIAFASPKQLCVITCGDDHTIKIWDASSGRKQYTFEGHEAPVYSVCPHHKESIQFIFSTAIDGRIKAWLYDDRGSRVDYVAPGNWCTTMSYSQDGNRLFSCGTSKDGETSLVEWNESEGAIRRAYKGFRRSPHNMQGVHQVVQFDTTKNRFLAAGDEGYIKFWDMDNTELLTQIDADAGLPLSPRVRFNKLGNLLAVNADNNYFKVLATKDGMALLRDFDVRKSATPQLGAKTEPVPATAVVPSKLTPPVPTPPVSEPSPPPTILAPRSREDEVVASIMAERKSASLVPATVATPKLLEFSEPSEVRSVRCPDSLPPAKIARLLYTNAGNSILALTTTAVHKVWKWTRGNVDRKMDPSTAWVLWQPSNGNMMTNDTSPGPESSSHCIALSKNDSYVMSASGGRVSLYNLLTFKVMTMFMPPPPAATVLTFHPDNNNIIAIGMDDASVQIYNVRNDEVETKLTGHAKAITGLAFLSVSKLLVSAGAAADLCSWNISSWTKRRSKTLPMVTGGETRAQAHAELSRVLVTHETMLGIYDADGLDLVARWSPKDAEHFGDPISAAAYSCDSAFVFAGFTNGMVAVFDGNTLTPVTRIALSVYSLRPVYPVVIASHPQKATQFALGSSDGSVYVLEPLEGVPDWTKKEVEELEAKSPIAQIEQGEQPRKHEVT